MMLEKTFPKRQRILHVRNIAALPLEDRLEQKTPDDFAFTFSRAGFDYVSVETGEHALLQISHLPTEERPTLVLVDAPLSDMSGSDFRRRMKSENANAKILVIQITKGSFAAPSHLLADHKYADIFLTAPVSPAFALYAAQNELRFHEMEMRSEWTHKIREEFLSGISHDLKNPLSAFKVTAQILQRDAEMVGPHGTLPAVSVSAHVARLLRTTERMEGLIRKIVDFALAAHEKNSALAESRTFTHPEIETDAGIFTGVRFS